MQSQCAWCCGASTKYQLMPPSRNRRARSGAAAQCCFHPVRWSVQYVLARKLDPLSSTFSWRSARKLAKIALKTDTWIEYQSSRVISIEQVSYQMQLYLLTM
ncbi:hypothetical protein SS50377_20743 [Spironucleus salmonicida]|uniref:Uncharacterized protein n=1 Tax=Spironucleus salmonicida TaxID=348837 RepID=A0A9P8LZX7_9EUKA|nr:hypothetical protein SS50377_20717 [Spironucleus salmonicida]KAH0577391.1 hypothetical protein SS50377_20743 [Spironucleus salmonicida]